MNARDLPGYGDAATFSPAALASLQLLEQMDADDQPTADDIAEAVQEAKDWMDTCFAALNAKNMPRARMARDRTLEIMQSIEVVQS